jgi:hypothetical protein
MKFVMKHGNRPAPAPAWWAAPLVLTLGLASPAAAQSLRDPGEAEVYLPLLQQALTPELHFARKLVQPNEEQFDEIHRAGRAAIAKIAGQYADLQDRRQKPETWPDPHQSIARALADAIGRLFPAEVADKYRDETEARFAANRQADAAVVVNLIDHKVMLTPQQQQQLLTVLVEAWQPHWSTGNLVLIHSQYAALPETEILQPHLSELQQQLWAYRPRTRALTLSWQVHFGASNLFGPVGLEEFQPPAAAAETKK